MILAMQVLLITAAIAVTTSTATIVCDTRPFDISKVASQVKRLATHSWEYGTAAEALLELHNPDLSVFSNASFLPNGRPPAPDPDQVESLAYAAQHIRLDNSTLIDGDGASGDPASLGVSAILIGQTNPITYAAAIRQYLHFADVPRWPNGAISHREAYAELWSDFIYMAPPFMAYFATSINSTEALLQAAQQCLLYREVLKPNVSAETVSAGAWQHIIGPHTADPGLWSTGNGWAAMGMARVLATMLHWPESAHDVATRTAKVEVSTAIGEILQGAMASPQDDGLLRNYLNDTTWFGETSGTALLTATVYRMAVLQRELDSSKSEQIVSILFMKKLFSY